MTAQTYPSGRVVTNQFETDGDLAQVNGSFNSQNKTYVSNLSYTSAGAVSSLQLGNGRWENTVFNSRLQPIQIGLGTAQNAQDLWKVNYEYGELQANGTVDQSKNNGNVGKQTITVPSQFTANQTYTYDSLNRLKTAEETVSNAQTWKQTFTFDRYGNRKFDPNQTTTLGNCPANVCNPDINPANNRVTTHTFDNSGNTTVDAEGRQFFYDGENKQKEVKNAQGQTIGQYLYDGDGKRIKKIAPNVETTIFVYDAGGRLASEYTVSASQQQAPATSYLTNDTLGSPRITTDQAGAVVSRRDFRPYGEEIARPNQGTDKIRQKFTGYERDNETDEDFAQARYLNYKLGRFNSVDPLLNTGRPDLPQSWHRYSYAINNPLKFVDPLGAYLCTAGDTNCEKFDTALQKAIKNLDAIKAKYGDTSEYYLNAKAAVDVYGKKGVDNGVTIKLAGPNSLPDEAFAGTDISDTKKKNYDKALNPEGKEITLTLKQKAFDDKNLIDTVVHEGSHAADGAIWAAHNFDDKFRPTVSQTEKKAYLVEALNLQVEGRETTIWYNPVPSIPKKGMPREQVFGPFQLWNPSWKTIDQSKIEIDVMLRHHKIYRDRLKTKAF